MSASDLPPPSSTCAPPVPVPTPGDVDTCQADQCLRPEGAAARAWVCCAWCGRWVHVDCAGDEDERAGAEVKLHCGRCVDGAVDLLDARRMQVRARLSLLSGRHPDLFLPDVPEHLFVSEQTCRSFHRPRSHLGGGGKVALTFGRLRKCLEDVPTLDHLEHHAAEVTKRLLATLSPEHRENVRIVGEEVANMCKEITTKERGIGVGGIQTRGAQHGGTRREANGENGENSTMTIDNGSADATVTAPSPAAATPTCDNCGVPLLPPVYRCRALHRSCRSCFRSTCRVCDKVEGKRRPLQVCDLQELKNQKANETASSLSNLKLCFDVPTPVPPRPIARPVEPFMARLPLLIDTGPAQPPSRPSPDRRPVEPFFARIPTQLQQREQDPSSRKGLPDVPIPLAENSSPQAAPLVTNESQGNLPSTIQEEQSLQPMIVEVTSSAAELRAVQASEPPNPSATGSPRKRPSTSISAGVPATPEKRPRQQQQQQPSPHKVVRIGKPWQRMEYRSKVRFSEIAWGPRGGAHRLAALSSLDRPPAAFAFKLQKCRDTGEISVRGSCIQGGEASADCTWSFSVVLGAGKLIPLVTGGNFDDSYPSFPLGPTIVGMPEVEFVIGVQR